MRYYLGVDGGGSKTTALVCSETGEAVATYVGGGVNYNAIGFDEARRSLREVVDGALRGGEFPLSAAFIGHSALSGRADADLTARLCGGIIPCEKITMDSDVYIALSAMKTEGACAAVICGTGSMAAGRLGDGTVLHAGGWGHLLGDEGSGYALSLDAVKAAIRGGEGSGVPTALTAAALRFFAVRDLDGLIGRFYDPPISRSAVAAFAPQFFECAAAGDAAAQQILSDHARSLAGTAFSLLRRFPPETPVGLWGGIFEHQPAFRDAFAACVREAYPCRIGLLPVPPVYGAVYEAIKSDRRA